MENWIDLTTVAERAHGIVTHDQLRAAATAEARLLVRNRTAVFNSVLMPLLLVAAVPALGIGVAVPRVGVQLAGELAVRALDLVGARVRAHAQRAVVVPRHRVPVLLPRVDPGRLVWCSPAYWLRISPT